MTETTGNNSTMDPTPVVHIKKYPNRRLYNTATSSYIVLDDIVDLIKGDVEFQITDTKTGADITRSILNQIIYERETAKGDHHFPLDVQKQFILMYDDAYGRMIPEYLRESMNLFVSEREKMKLTLDEIVNQNSKTMVEFGDHLAKQNIDFFNRTFELFQTMSGLRNDRSKPENQADDSTFSDDETRRLKDIQEQIDKLQAELKSIRK